MRRAVQRDVVRHERVAGRAVRPPDAGHRPRASRRRRARGASCSCRPPRLRRAPPARRASRWPAPCPARAGASAATRARSRSKISSSRSSDALVGAEHLLFVLLQRRRDEPLAARDRLLAHVVGRDGVQVRLRDLDVVAEHAVEADLERRDPRPRALALFHLGDDLLARAADRAAARRARRSTPSRIDAAVAGERRRLVDERRARCVAQIGQIVELRQRGSDERRLQLAEDRRTRGTAHERLSSGRRDRAGRRRRARRAPRGARGRAPPSAPRGACRARSCGTRAPRPRRDGPESARARPAAAGATTRSSRPPIGVTVRSSSSSSEPARPPSAPSTIRVLERDRDRSAGRRSPACR